jgi:hypothetical protein
MQLFVCPSFQGPSPKQVLLLPEIIHATCVGMRLWTWDLQNNNEQKHIVMHFSIFQLKEGFKDCCLEDNGRKSRSWQLYECSTAWQVPSQRVRCTVFLIWLIFFNFGLRITVQCREEMLLLVMRLCRTGGFSFSTNWELTANSHKGAGHCGKR